MTQYTQEAADMIRANYIYDAERGYILSKYSRGSVPPGAIIHSRGTHHTSSIRLKAQSYQTGAVVWLFNYGTWPTAPVRSLDRTTRYPRIMHLYQFVPESDFALLNGVIYIPPLDRGRCKARYETYYHGRRLGDFDTVVEASAAWFEEDAAWIG